MTARTLPDLKTLYFYLTEGCNLACKHCWLNPPFEKGSVKFPVIEVKKFQQAIEEAKPLGLRSVKITGGEPLLHPQVQTILDLLLDAHLRLIVETNGVLINRSIAEKFSKFASASISTSLDSINPETHDAIRNSPGAFEKTIRGINILVEHGLRPQIITSLLPENKNELPEIIRFASDLNAGSFKLNIVQPTERGQKLDESGQTVQIKEIIEIVHNLHENHCKKYPIPISVTVPFAFRPLSLLTSGHSSRCGILNILGVLPTGHYALCGVGSLIEEMVFGKVGQDKLSNVWNTNPVLEFIRNELPDRFEGICHNCVMKQICLGSCMAQNYYKSRDLKASYWFCEEAEKIGLFPESRKIIARNSKD